MRGNSEEQMKTIRMLEFFRRKLNEAKERDESNLMLMISRDGPVQFDLHGSHNEDAPEDMQMSGAEADSTFLRAVEEGLIHASFGSGGPHATTAIANITHITAKGLRMLDSWEDDSQQPTQQFTFNAPAYGIFGSQQDFTFEQVIQDMDRQIEEHGGEDKEELREMVEEIRETLESQDSISRSKFERWSELANKHMPWLLGPLGTLLIKYVFSK